MANHQSIADIAMVYKTHMQFKWVAKEILFRIPVFGWCMSGMKYIKLTRGEFGSIKKVYQEAAQWLKRDISVLFFPERTRSSTDNMNAFKSGAFRLAIQEGKLILPILIEGSRNLIPRGSWIFKIKASCKLTVLPEIDTTKLQPEDSNLLIDKVRQILAGAN